MKKAVIYRNSISHEDAKILLANYQPCAQVPA